jgi:hypothetical protein
MRTLNVAINLEATPDRLADILTTTHAYDKPYQAGCSSVVEDASLQAGRDPPHRPDALLT